MLRLVKASLAAMLVVSLGTIASADPLSVAARIFGKSQNGTSPDARISVIAARSGSSDGQLGYGAATADQKLDFASALGPAASMGNATVAGAPIVGVAIQPDGVINARAHGARCDGTTDDTAAINSALSAGRNIYIPDGSCMVSGIAITATGERIFGNGAIKLKDGTNKNVITVSADNVTIEGIEIDGNRDHQSLGEAETTKGGGNGVYLTNGVSNFTLWHAYIHDTALSGFAGYGNHANLRIQDNRFENLGYSGIYPTFASNRPVTNSLISGNRILNIGLLRPVMGGGDGIGTVGMQQSVISNNIIRGFVFAGIALEAGNVNLIVTGNNIEGSVMPTGRLTADGSVEASGISKCIQLNDGWNTAVIGNLVKKCQIGIVVSGGSQSKNYLIADNVVSFSINGIQIDSGTTPGTTEAKVQVIGNIISNSYESPIRVLKVVEVLVSGNVVEGVNLGSGLYGVDGYGIAVGQGAARVIVRDNIIRKDSTGAAGEALAGHMDVGVGEVAFAGYLPQQNYFTNNRIVGAMYYDVLTHDWVAYGTPANGAHVEGLTQYADAPTTGQWKIGDRSYRARVSAGGSIGDVCITSGQFGNQATTGTIKAGSSTIIVAETTGFFSGMRILVSGAGPGGTNLNTYIGQIDRIAKTFTLANPAGTSVTDHKVTLVVPVFKAFGAIAR